MAFPKYHHFPIIFPGFFWLFLVKSTKIHQNPPGSVIADRLYGFEIDIDFPQIFLTQNHSDECHGCAFRGLPRGDGPGMVDGPGRWCRVSGRCYGFFFLGWSMVLVGPYLLVNGNYIHRKTNHGGYSFHGVYPLVGGLEHGWIMTFHILGISSFHLTNSYFSEGWLNHQPG